MKNNSFSSYSPHKKKHRPETRFYDVLINFKNTLQKAIGYLETADLNSALDYVREDLLKKAGLEFESSFSVKRKFGKIVAIHVISVECPDCHGFSIIEDVTSIVIDELGHAQIACKHCKEFFFLKQGD